MLKFTQHSFVDIEKYEERLNIDRFVYMDKERIRNILPYEQGRRDTLSYLAKRTMRANSSREYNDLGPDVVYSYLVDTEGCSVNRFRSKNAKGYSLDSKKVLSPLLDSNMATEFLSYYMEFKSLVTKCGRMTNLMKEMQQPKAKSRDGNDLYEVWFSVNKQDNLRYNYNNTDLISLPVEYGSAFAAPEGYVLAWGDFHQSDFRIAYNLLIRDNDNYEIMKQYEDCYAGMAAIVAHSLGEKFDIEKFKEEREEFKVHILATIYGQRHGDSPEAQKFINKLAAYLDRCPRYKEFYTRIKKRIRLGLVIPITGYFGFDQMLVTDHRDESDIIDKTLNAPCQTGTSEIVILSSNAILDKFYELGYTEEDIRIHHVRHDEPIFILKEEVLKDAWVFNEASTIIVDNWMPLRLTFDFGYRYTEVDNRLSELVQKNYEDNKNRITIVEPSEPEREYWPVPATYEIYVGLQEVGTETIVAYYNEDSNGVKYLKVGTTDPEELYKVVRAATMGIQEKLRELGYSGVVVFNPIKDEEVSDSFMYYRFKKSVGSDKRMNLVGLLAHWTAYKYAVREKINFVPSMDALNSNKEMLYEVGALDVFERQD